MAGDRLGLVGLSGNTEFPHVHLVLRRNGQVVDPFDPDGQITCGTPDPETLWSLPVTYAPGALLNMGFATAVPDYDSVKAGTAGMEAITRDAPALVVWGFAFGGRKGDSMRIRITGPSGSTSLITATHWTGIRHSFSGRPDARRRRAVAPRPL
jgi:hypothetical protein